MKMTVNLGKDSYPIYIRNNILSFAHEYISEVFSGKRIMVISDDHVFALYGEILMESLRGEYECHSLVLPHGESTKDFQTLPSIYSALLNAHISRSDLIIALGGGVIGDLAGFAASSYLRGVKFIQIPTSLLAQVDSSVGGKVAVNHALGKNMIGAFYQPKLVLIDMDALQTLEERHWRNGLAEVVKYGVIYDAAFFTYLKENAADILAR